MLRKRWPGSASSMFWAGFALTQFNEPALLDDAIAAYREAIRLKPDFVSAYDNLGSILSEKGLLDDAIAARDFLRDPRPILNLVCVEHCGAVLGGVRALFFLATTY